MKMTKKRSSMVALLTKRKKFGGLFFTRWIVVLSILAIIGLLVGERILKESYSTEYDNYNMTAGRIIGAIKDVRDDESYERYLNRIRYAMGYARELGTASILYNADTYEIIAGFDERIYLIKKGDDAESGLYSCDLATIEGWDEYYENVNENMGFYEYEYSEIEIDHIYVKDGIFIPGEFKMIAKAETKFGDNIDIIYSQEFEEPENVPEGFVREEVDDSYSAHRFILGYNENKPEPYACTSNSYNVVKSLYEENFGKDSGEVYGEIYYGTFEYSLADQQEFTLPNGETAVLITARYYDGWVQHGEMYIIAAIIIFVVSAILAFILAKISYIKLKAHYDMEDYRKTLMNTMAHDLKSPLMSISGYAENLHDNINTDKREHYAKAILGNVQYMNGIIESVLTLGKTENANVELKKEKTSIKVLVDKCLKKYELQKEEKQLGFDITGDGVLDIDIALFTQAVDNLIGNAVKYAKNDSVIKVTISEKSMSIVNECEDELNTDVNKLCEPFVVGNENRSDKCGNGLGLAIVNNVCRLHKYELKLKYEENVFTSEIVFRNK